VERQGRSDLELVIQEIMEDKITAEFVPSDAAADTGKDLLA
jgi:hypothetical protein